MVKGLLLALAGLVVAAANPALAQQPVPGIDNAIAKRQQRIGQNHWKFTGDATDPVVIKIGDAEVYTDEIEVFSDQDRAIATGHFVLVQGGARITADRADFNTKTKLGTFYNAFGFATVKPPPPQPGGLVIPPSNQETDVYFSGETVEKVGARKYKITKGGFTTCVQPTPRWMLTSSTVLLNLDHYTFLRDAVFTVKGVPLLYTPVLYYPTKREDRATGFLIPTYGQSSLRGHTFHNAFFWAVDRSQDVTVMHDWYSKTGQGVGTEYRYNFGGFSAGNFTVHVLDEHATAYTNGDGSVYRTPDTRSFEIRGGANQMLPSGLRARASVNYFSSLQTMQTFNTNIYDASRSVRDFGGNIVRAWSTYTMNVTIDRREYFYNSTNSGLSGNLPRVTLTRSERPIGTTPFYVTVGGEYATLVRETRDTRTPANNVDSGLTRLDFAPQVRFPFKKWQWFTVNSSILWRDTYYTRSLENSQIVDEDLNRRFFTAQAQMTGPVFMRVWDTPDNGYAEKFKHTIEPFLNIQRTSTIDNFNQIIVIDGIDGIVGGTQYTYGLFNRFYAKRRIGQTSQPREIVNVQVIQTYYTDQRAAQYDPRYSTSFSGTQPSNYSPISLRVQALPTNDVNATVSADFDSHYHSLRTISANGSYAWTGRLQTSVGWSKRNFIKELEGFNDPSRLDQFINASANVHTRDNRVGGVYSFNYDVLRGSLLQQRMSAFYNAQCCGVAVEYQTFNFGGVSGIGIPSDHRFFLSFTLAGLGNFSPFNGAMSGIPR